MKRVKIMLTAITVFAVVGGALAFKAKSATIFCSTTISPKAACPALSPSTWDVNPDTGISYCTTNGSFCDLRVDPKTDN